jgi:membrane protein YdbS with pleckstrin-like domain
MVTFNNEEILELPDITKIEFKRVDKSYLKVILITFFILFIIFFSGLTLLHLCVFSDEIIENIGIVYLVVISLFGCVFSYLLFGFPKRKYALREKDISYKSGLFVKTITTVPFSRIQHVETDEKPISRIFGLSSLSVFTAGDSSDDLVIKGILKEEALQIKEFISTKINE